MAELSCRVWLPCMGAILHPGRAGGCSVALSIPGLLCCLTQLRRCFGPQPALAPSSVLSGISTSVFLLCRDHGGS